MIFLPTPASSSLLFFPNNKQTVFGNLEKICATHNACKKVKKAGWDWLTDWLAGIWGCNFKAGNSTLPLGTRGSRDHLLWWHKRDLDNGGKQLIRRRRRRDVYCRRNYWGGGHITKLAGWLAGCIQTHRRHLFRVVEEKKPLNRRRKKTFLSIYQLISGGDGWTQPNMQSQASPASYSRLWMQFFSGFSDNLLTCVRTYTRAYAHSLRIIVTIDPSIYGRIGTNRTEQSRRSITLIRSQKRPIIPYRAGNTTYVGYCCVCLCLSCLDKHVRSC